MVELACGDKAKLNPADETAKSPGFGPTVPAARTQAKTLARAAAVADAYRAAAKYDCGEGCPVRELTLHIAEPTAAYPKPVVIGGSQPTLQSEGECDWDGSMKCLASEDAPEQHDEMGLANVEFECDDDWTIIFEGEVVGDAVTVAFPYTAQEVKDAIARAGDNLSRGPTAALESTIMSAVGSFSCPRLCRNKLMKVHIWPAKTRLSMNVRFGMEVAASCWLAISAKCGS